MKTFLGDLIDHQGRVSKHMQEASHVLLNRIIHYGNNTAYVVNEERATLFDLIDVACRWRLDGVSPFKMSEQTKMLVQRTSDVYFTGNDADDVAWWRATLIEDLFHRAAVHDNSKLDPEEFDLYNAAFPELQKYAYGSPEFNVALQMIQPALSHHYKANDHHPEHFQGGISEMHLVQVIEMLCDWLAASERSQTDFMHGMEINKGRFNISDQLYSTMKNTVIPTSTGTFRIVDSRG